MVGHVPVLKDLGLLKIVVIKLELDLLVRLVMVQLRLRLIKNHSTVIKVVNMLGFYVFNRYLIILGIAVVLIGLGSIRVLKIVYLTALDFITFSFHLKLLCRLFHYEFILKSSKIRIYIGIKIFILNCLVYNIKQLNYHKIQH